MVHPVSNFTHGAVFIDPDLCPGCKTRALCAHTLVQKRWADPSAPGRLFYASMRAEMHDLQAATSPALPE
jgi:hypothetical protein